MLTDGSIVEIENIAEDKAGTYRMNPVGVAPFLEQIAATWHTHPNSDPTLSGEDHDGFLAWPDLEHKIIGRRDGAVVITSYRVDDGVLIVCD